MSSLICILHIDSSISNDPVKAFASDTWKKVKEVAEIRIERTHGCTRPSKYLDVCQKLPTTLTELHGYHRTCYSNFIAIRPLPENEQYAAQETQPAFLLRSQSQHQQSTSSTGIMPRVCIFCDRVRKTINRKEVPLVSCEFDSPELNVKEAAHVLEDRLMLTKISNIGFHSKEVKYHNACKRNYLNRARSASSKSNNKKVQTDHDVNEKAFVILFSYIRYSVIDSNCPELLKSIHQRFCQSIEKLAIEQGITPPQPISPRTLGDKIMSHFEGEVILDKEVNKKGIVLFNSSTEKQKAFQMAAQCCSSDEFTVVEAAKIIRKSILDISKTVPPLPSPLTLGDIKSGQATSPDILLKFLKTLYTGFQNDLKDYIKRKVDSVSQDILYNVSRGRIKTAKHMCMGVGMKSITGSKKVLNILNRFGHSISYHVAEEIETELAMFIANKRCVLPNMLLAEAGLSTGTAWDNYDELTETLSGKDTLHDTVGICYQNKTVHNAVSVEIPSQPSQLNRPAKRRRQFEPQENNITPYNRKPSLNSFSYKIYSSNTPTNIGKVNLINKLWMISCHLSQNTPMWRGWNSSLYTDSLPQQVIGYMENIELPPTRLDVIQQTLRISQKVADECGDKFAIVHYDLAIAKPALKIQAQESPMYDNVFICFGTFHICMAYFASLGYILESSGGPELLCDTDVLANGSLRGFLSGKHFNRCKRLHPLLATSLEILHFRKFIALDRGFTGELKDLLQVMTTNPSEECLSNIEASDAFLKLIERYEHFCEATRLGSHGATAKFWKTYIDLVHIYLLLDRACRTNDVDLYSYAIAEMCPVFFATHRPNYARWMTRYHLNLINMNTTHAGIREVFDAGALSIRRTHRSFSRSAVDLTLEQTVNRDAASRQGGIASFTQSVNARKRWMVTRSARGSIVGCLLEMAGLSDSDEVTKELRPTRIKRDNEDLDKLLKGVEDTLNPFTINDNKLYCLTTGRAASSNVANDMLSIVQKGSSWYKEFVSECKDNPLRFDEPIKRRKVKNFAQDALKTKIKGKDNKIKEVQCTRDLFGRLLYLAVSQNIDMEIVLCYPLTPVPLMLCHIDGSINKTSKAALMQKLEKKIKTMEHGKNEAMEPTRTEAEKEEPASTDVVLIDAMFFFRTLGILPTTFGGIAKTILQKACSYSRNVHIICDTYTDGPSIKQLERNSRGDCRTTYCITGPSQQRPRDFNGALLSATFKTSLLRFLKDEWKSEQYATLLKGHTLNFAMENSCYKYNETSGIVTQCEVPELRSMHEEADTRIIQHAKVVADMNDTSPNIVVRCSDTDIFILLLHHSVNIKATLWMDTGTSSNNTRRYINITKLASTLTESVCSALPGFHSFTGCDYTASFLRKAKSKPYELMVKHNKFKSAFSGLGCSNVVDEDVAATIEEFVCMMYGVHNVTDVNETRFRVFEKLYAPKKNTKNPLDKIKSSDPCCMPPCKTVLCQKLKRANYVSHIWKNAMMQQPVQFEPDGHGWKLLSDNSLDFVWFEGPQSPTLINYDDIQDSTDSEDDDDDISPYNSSSDEDEDDYD